MPLHDLDVGPRCVECKEPAGDSAFICLTNEGKLQPRHWDWVYPKERANCFESEQHQLSRDHGSVCIAGFNPERPVYWRRGPNGGITTMTKEEFYALQTELAGIPSGAGD